MSGAGKEMQDNGKVDAGVLDLTTRLLDRCLVCDGAKLRDVLDLGEMPLANAFHDGSKRQQKYPLVYRVCQSCWHGQLSVAIDPKEMFSNYLYVSGTTRTLLAYMDEFVTRVERDFGERKLDVLEIGSNDGSLLREFFARDHIVLGIDPSGLSEDFTLKAFWDVEAAKTALQIAGPFDAIIAMNVLAHVADPVTFLKLCKRVLAPGGRIYVQTSQAMMLLNGEFDAIYHEHVSYFTARSMKTLAERASLFVHGMSRVPIHGKSMLVELVHADGIHVDNIGPPDLVTDESRLGYYTPEIYDRFATLAKYKKEYAVKTIESCRANGYAIVGYGAAAKGMTFLNYTGIELDAIVDDNPLKVGKLCPGNDIEVRAIDSVTPGTFHGYDGDVTRNVYEKICWLILAWNFSEEIIERIRNARPDNNDLFVTYFPSAKIQ